MRGYIEVSHGVAVEFNPDSVPSIQWNHIDGPLLHMRSGEIHWLTGNVTLDIPHARGRVQPSGTGYNRGAGGAS